MMNYMLLKLDENIAYQCHNSWCSIYNDGPGRCFAGTDLYQNGTRNVTGWMDFDYRSHMMLNTVM